MSVSVKFFASLREQTGLDEVQLNSATTVLEAWQQATGQPQLPANTLCAVNMEYASPERAVNDGDEVAFFPPVTGG
jgi:molybdopterin synthase sulfur carrier subunit